MPMGVIAVLTSDSRAKEVYSRASGFWGSSATCLESVAVIMFSG